MRKPVTLRRTKTDGRALRTMLAFDVRHNGVVLAKIQRDNEGGGWFWYGMRGVSGNTASNMREFDVVKAEIISLCQQYVAKLPVSSIDREGK